MTLFTNASIRSRLIGALVLMLIPLLLLGSAAFFSLQRSVESVDQIVGDTLDELVPMQKLKYGLAQSSLHAQKFFFGGTVESRDIYLQLEHDAEQLFDQLLNLSFRFSQQRALLEESREEWQQARAIAAEIFARLGETGRTPPGSSELLSQMNEHIASATEIMDQKTLMILDETKQHDEESHKALTDLVAFVGVLLGLSFFMAVGASILLTRSILPPLRRLQDGVRIVGEGDLSHRVPAAFPSELGELASTFNGMAERLEELTIRDELTGLFNRREMDRRLEEEIVRARRYNHPLSLLMMDIDHFKAVNDTHGHQAGDAVLRQIARRIEGALRPIDWVARYGGEELAAILPETDTVSAEHVAERVRSHVEREPFLLDSGLTIPVTLCIGVATYPHHAELSYHLISAADTGVYDAKKAGRNCVKTATGTLA